MLDLEPIVHNILDLHVPGFLHQVMAHLGQAVLELSLLNTPGFWQVEPSLLITPFVGG